MPVDNKPIDEKIAKVIARAGICSRREAERRIEDGRVELDGKIMTSPAVRVTSANNIKVDGKDISKKDKTRLWLYYKPDGLITTHSDPQGRKTVFESLPENMPRVISVGRLDLNTEGLLLLTNDGELSRYLESPKNNMKRTYKVRVYGNITERELKKLSNGVSIQDPDTGDVMHYGKIEARFDKENQKEKGKNFWINMSIWEGKNREIRIICSALDLQVNRLIRTDYGPFSLEKMKEGDIKEIDYKEISSKFGDVI